MTTDSEPLDEPNQSLVIPVWIIQKQGDEPRMVLSLGVPRPGEILTIDSVRHTVAMVNWNHVPCADGSLCLRPELTLQRSQEPQT